MPTPEEIEAAAGIQPGDEVDRRRIWAAAQAHAGAESRPPAAEDLRIAEAMLQAADDATAEHLAEGRGRAIITLTDSGGEDEVEVSLELVPEPEDLGDTEVSVTPAQLLALELIEGAFGDQPGHDHGAHH